MEIHYDDNGRLILSHLDCDCGCAHNQPDLDVYVGAGILANCAEYIRNRKLGVKAVLVADNITYEIAGRYVERLLSDEGFNITLCLLEREGELEPDATALGEVLLTMEADTQYKWGHIREGMEFLPSADEMINLLKKLGAPVTAAEIGINVQLLARTLKCAKDYRSRYNLCKALEELGLLDEVIKTM